MSGHPRGVYWKDMLEPQRAAASGLGFTEESWDKGAPPPAIDVVEKQDNPVPPSPESIVITLDNVGSQSLYNMRQWLEYRKAYDQKTHGPPGSKIFVKLITAILLDEQQDKERQRLEELNLRQQALKSELDSAKQKRKAEAVQRSLLRQQETLSARPDRFSVQNCIKRVRLAHRTGRCVNVLADAAGAEEEEKTSAENSSSRSDPEGGATK